MVTIINPNSRSVYQGLANTVAAVEPPLWCRLMYSYLAAHGVKARIVDAQLWNMSADELAKGSGEAIDSSLVVIMVYGQQPSASTQTMPAASDLCKAIKAVSPQVRVVLVGTHCAALPEQTLRESGADFVATGDGFQTVLDLARNPELPPAGSCYLDGPYFKRVTQGRLFNDLDNNLLSSISWAKLSGMKLGKYRCHNWHGWGHESRTPYASIYTSLGCPYTCLRGDTLINTIYGMIPIREMAETMTTCPVYTYKNNRVEIANAFNICKTGINKKLVRVMFDDGTHIDCTPDHRFLTFKWGNGRANSGKAIEREIEASKLKSGMHIRAIKTRVELNRAVVYWGRRLRRHRSRLVMEYLLGRRLVNKEQVHHRDGDKLNDHPRNLEYCSSNSEHILLHHSQHFSERMKANNPAWRMTPEWRDNIAKSQRGLRRSLESRLRYRESKLGAKNPNYRHGRRSGTRSRIEDINHRVTKVVELSERDDVYCMEVPHFGWFFANNVLVHNCSFCCIQAPFKEADGQVFKGKANSYRMWSPVHVADEIELLATDYGVKHIKIADEMFLLNRNHVEGIVDELLRRGFTDRHLNIWFYSRVDTVGIDERLIEKMRKAGFTWAALGIESIDEKSMDAVDKRDYTTSQTVEAVRRLQRNGISVMANYIFGLPNDTTASMQRTLDFAMELRTECVNMYAAVAFPGSPLYGEKIKEGWLPPAWSAYSFHGYDHEPLGTESLTPAEVLKFRDEAVQKYFNDAGYLNLVERKFGKAARFDVRNAFGIKLKRKLLGD